MRGGRRRPSSSVSQKQTGMAMTKKDGDEAPFGSQQVENMQEEEEEDADIEEALSSSLLPPDSPPDRCRRGANKSKPREMTEEEMVDLALRLSEQEASLTALRQQKEEEAVRRAIQESQVASHTPPCPPSQNPLDDAEPSLRICSWRELAYTKRKPTSAIDQRPAEDSGTPQTDLNRGFKRCKNSDARAFQALERRMNKRLRRKEGSPPAEIPDLSQTQEIDSQASPGSSDVPDLPLDSPQSSDSTQIEDFELHKSPVFPLTGCRAEVRIPPLDWDVLQACMTSGFVCCSQDGLISPQKLSLAQPKSPTFPKSPELSGNARVSKSTMPPRSPVFSETDQDGEIQSSPEYVRSPVFGRNTQRETSPSAFKRQVGVCNSGFVSFSQESLASSVRSMTCQPKSPVFPGSPSPPPERPATCKSPVFSQTGQSRGRCTSPVSGRAGQEICPHEQKHRSSPSPAGLRDARGDRSSALSEGRVQSPRRDGESERNRHARFSASPPSDAAEEKTSKDQGPERVEPTSNMTLLWSDEDEDVTPVGSPSPVFPVEGPALQAAGQPASLDRGTAAPAGTSRPSSSSALSGRQRPPAALREPTSGQGADGGASASPGSTVYYYWGVPFCPRGLDPDDYTQVILAQMEVYEKSLKRAQRGLLRKAEWGEAVLPQPEKSPSSESPAASPQQLFPQRRGLRLRGPNQDNRPAEAEDNKGEEGEEEEEERGGGGGGEEEGKRDEGEGQADVDDCDICPETQLSDDDNRTQDLMRDRVPERPHRSPELPGVETLLQSEPAEEEPMALEPELEEHQQTEENDSDVGGQHVRKEEVVKDWGVPNVVESKDRGPQRSTSPELELVVPQNPEASVDCPICQRPFPVTEIEMHAAFCEGEADDSKASPKPRRKRTRRAEVASEDTGDAANAVRNQEKCYICQRMVPLREYSRHTELCIHRQRSGPAAKENLLSALEKTESRDSGAGPSGSRVQPGDVIDLRDDDEDDGEEGGASTIPISNSPIKSFIPISEATGCLIDFKKQHQTKKLSQRRRWRPPED